MEEAGLADSRVAHHSDDLSAAGLGEVERFLELLHLTLPTYKPRQPPPSGDLEPCPQGANPKHLVEVDRFADAFDGCRAERLELEIPLRQFVSVLADYDRARSGETLHARGESRRMPNWGVLRVQVVFADRAQHNLTSV